MVYDDHAVNYIQNLSSRSTVGYALEQLYKCNPKIMAVYADVGSRFGIKDKLGRNSIEIGIAEQSLIPILGGLAHEGYIPFGIAYAPFLTIRAADQIRMTIGEMGLNVKLIGGSAGLVSGNLGAASLALDDLSIMRCIPNLMIVSPADCLSVAWTIEQAVDIRKPVYIRLTGDKLPAVYHSDSDFSIGKANILCNYGEDVVIYANGAEVYRAVLAADALKGHNIYAAVVDMATIKPLDTEVIDRYSGVKKIVSVEEHNKAGGLGSAIAEYITEKNDQSLLRIGVDDTYLYPDAYENLLEVSKLSAESITAAIVKFMKE